MQPASIYIGILSDCSTTTTKQRGRVKKKQGALDASLKFLSCVLKCYGVVHAMCTINSCDSIANIAERGKERDRERDEKKAQMLKHLQLNQLRNIHLRIAYANTQSRGPQNQ